ncbi:hypothetical protein B0H13DRAFT_1887782 [Mycena leptocephala]|nr:hypothetical protein B0H13DRAFT_1887782 [Mycena leptocephala]
MQRYLLVFKFEAGPIWMLLPALTATPTSDEGSGTLDLELRKIYVGVSQLTREYSINSTHRVEHEEQLQTNDGGQRSILHAQKTRTALHYVKVKHYGGKKSGGTVYVVITDRSHTGQGNLAPDKNAGGDARSIQGVQNGLRDDVNARCGALPVPKLAARVCWIEQERQAADCKGTDNERVEGGQREQEKMK